MADDLTVLLTRMQRGDALAGQRAIALVYSELHRIASRELRKERPGHLLQTTALLHEAYTRLMGSGGPEIHNRVHFLAMASQQMRRVLVDYARSNSAQKRGGGAPKVALDEVPGGPRGRDAFFRGLHGRGNLPGAQYFRRHRPPRLGIRPRLATRSYAPRLTGVQYRQSQPAISVPRVAKGAYNISNAAALFLYGTGF